MYSNRSAVQTSECVNVAKNNKKRSTLYQDFIRAVKSLHYVTVKKDQLSWLTAALAASFGQGFEQSGVTVEIVIILFH